MTLSVRLVGHDPHHQQTRVLLDGRNITPFLRRIAIQAGVDALTEVTLDLIGVGLETDLHDMAIPVQYTLPFPEGATA